MTPQILKRAPIALGGVAATVVMCLLAFVLAGRVVINDAHGQTGLLYSLASDPTAGGGLAAPQWQLLVRTDAPSLYFKSGTANTAWTRIGAGGGGGNVSGSGTATHMAKWSALHTVADSIATDDGSTLTVAGDIAATSVAASANVTAGGNVTATGNVSAPTLGATISASLGVVSALDVDGQNFNVSTALQVGAAGNINFVTGGGAITSTVGAPAAGCTSGSLDMDSTGKAWLCTGGGAWSQLSTGGGGASPFYDTVINVGPGLAAQLDDWNPGALGQNTLVNMNTTGAATLVTGLANGVVGKIVTLRQTIAPPTFGNFKTASRNVASLSANEFENFDDQTYPFFSHGFTAVTYYYNGSRWIQISGNANAL